MITVHRKPDVGFENPATQHGWSSEKGSPGQSLSILPCIGNLESLLWSCCIESTSSLRLRKRGGREGREERGEGERENSRDWIYNDYRNTGLVPPVSLMNDS